MEFLKKNIGLFIALAFAILYILWERHKLKSNREKLNDTGEDVTNEEIFNHGHDPLPPDYAKPPDEQPVDLSGRDEALYPDPDPIPHSEDEIKIAPTRKENRTEPFVKFKSKYSVFN
ncbi:hypothetical protein [Lentimicrobium sp. S6]|uniref:hypothetical protein n=1 Tax=Lentimicrobium sp. S6 TaxID=2735872 RepID=UPI0015580E92|nr:hypothetical protein [Lentimicrobium sp. S6]NPD47490.1 hypothetical protein [Lentimicrobium sp. S6]